MFLLWFFHYRFYFHNEKTFAKKTWEIQNLNYQLQTTTFTTTWYSL